MDFTYADLTAVIHAGFFTILPSHCFTIGRMGSIASYSTALRTWKSADLSPSYPVSVLEEAHASTVVSIRAAFLPSIMPGAKMGEKDGAMMI